MQVEKKSIKPFRWPPPTTCTSTALASVRYAQQKRSFCFAHFEWRDSGERAYLPGIRLLLPSALKIPAWLFTLPYWPRLRVGQYVRSENNRRYFLGLGNKVYIFVNKKWQYLFLFYLLYIGSTEALPILCVRCARWERERERERERESEREREKRKWRHLSSAEIGDEFCTFPRQKFAP